MEKLIPRNLNDPGGARPGIHADVPDGQTAMALYSVQGERELVTDCRLLAR